MSDARRDVEVVERVDVLALADLLAHEGFQVGGGDFLLLVGDLLEAAEGLVQLGPLQMDAELGQMRPQRVAAGVLAQHDVGLGQPDVPGVHDLVGGALLQHPVLVDAGFVSEGILAHDRLVGLHHLPGEARDHAAGAGDLGGDDVHRPLQ